MSAVDLKEAAVDRIATKPFLSQATVVRAVLLVGLVTLFGFLFTQYRHLLTLDELARREAELRHWLDTQPLTALAAAFVIYVAVTGLSLPGAAILSMVYGWLFGFWQTVVLVSFASTSGATLAFLMSRYLFRDAIQSRFGDRLARFNAALEAEGAFYLFTLRLIPAVPFFVINAVMGLTPLKIGTFWWVSQLGMLPGTAVYVYAGASVPDLQTLAEKGASGILSPQLIAAFVLLGVFPLAVKKLVTLWRPTPTMKPEA